MKKPKTDLAHFKPKTDRANKKTREEMGEYVPRVRPHGEATGVLIGVWDLPTLTNYKPMQNVRPGADDHKQFKSRGVA